MLDYVVHYHLVWENWTRDEPFPFQFQGPLKIYFDQNVGVAWKGHWMDEKPWGQPDEFAESLAAVQREYEQMQQ